MSLQTLEKSEKFAKWPPKGANPAPGLRRWWWFGPLGSPGRPRARPESRKRPSGKREKGPEGKKASGKVEKRKSWKGKVGKKEIKRDLARQWARGPANLIAA